MAKKRIKVKGTPRGLSKRERQDIHHFTNRGSLGGRYGAGRNRDLMYTVKRVNRDGTVEPHVSPFADKNPMSRPSSTRKKRVKEGNRKFIGPRQFKNVDKEEAANEFGIRPHPSRNYGWKANIRGGQFKEDSRPDFDSIGSERLKEMLMKILYERGLAMPF